MNYKQLAIEANGLCKGNEAWEWEEKYAELVMMELRGALLNSYGDNYKLRAKLDNAIKAILTP